MVGSQSIKRLLCYDHRIRGGKISWMIPQLVSSSSLPEAFFSTTVLLLLCGINGNESICEHKLPASYLEGDYMFISMTTFFYHHLLSI